MKIGFILSYRSPAKLQKHNSLVSLSFKTKEMQKNSLKVASEFKLVYFDAMEMRHTVYDENNILNLELVFDS